MVGKTGITYEEFCAGKGVSMNMKKMVKNALIDTYQALSEAKAMPDKDYQSHLGQYCSEVAKHVDSILVSSGQLEHMLVDGKCYVGFDKPLNWIIEHAPKGGVKRIAASKIKEYAKAIEGTETYESVKNEYVETMNELWKFLQRATKKG